MIEKWADRIQNMDEVRDYQAEAAKKSDFERTEVAKEKTGVRLDGVMAINPVNEKEIPIFISDYVLVSYGTGAIMAVPGHDTRDWDFAKNLACRSSRWSRAATWKRKPSRTAPPASWSIPASWTA